MGIARRLMLGLLSSLFVTLLFAAAFDIGFVRTATNPEKVKQLVSESGIYRSVVPNLLSQTKTISTNLGDISTKDTAIQQAANKALTPQDVKAQTEPVIDNIYAWLDGKIERPNFKISLAGVKSDFGVNVAKEVQTRLSKLAACSPAQSLAISRSNDYLNANCLPAGVSPAAAAAQVRRALNGSNDFIEKTNITPDTIKQDGSRQSVFDEQLKQAPQRYQLFKKTPFLLTVLAILTGVGIFFLSDTRQKGLRRIGISLLIVGILMMLFAWAVNRTMNTNVIPKISFDNAFLKQDITALARDITGQINKNYWFFGILYAVLGAAVIVIAQTLMRPAGQVIAAKSAGTPGSGGTSRTNHIKKP